MRSAWRDRYEHQAPTLSTKDAEQLVSRADEIMRETFSAFRIARLSEVFRGRALKVLETQAQSLDKRGVRTEERNVSRVLVFWDPSACEAVLQVVGEQRLVTPDQPSPEWAATLRQWWARLQSVAGGWWVVDQRDLAPDRWRPLPHPAG